MVVQSQLACRPHWYSIPSEIRSRLWTAYRSNNTIRHEQALVDAVSFLRAQMPRQQTSEVTR